MNPEVKEKWLEALRSGRYVQGAGQLHYKTETTDSYCCLGVLCNLAVDEGVTTRLSPDAILHTLCGGVDVEYGHEAIYLPGEVQAWAGFLDRDPCSNVTGQSLAQLNDDGASFAEIANIIERDF